MPRRAAKAARRSAPVLGGHEPLDGLLRLRTVKEKTRQLHTTVSNAFFLDHALTPHSPPELLDTVLDADIVQLYLAGEDKA